MENNNNKVTGPDEILVEILKLINGKYMILLVKLFNQVYDNGQFPKD